MTGTAEIKALLVTRDSEMVSVFSQFFREISISVQTYQDESNASMGLEMTRFEALVLDFDNLSRTSAVIQSLRQSSSSKNALVFAVASYAAARQRALEQGANFAFERPFKPAQIKNVLHTAYSLMLRERRRYFRHAVSLSVRLHLSSGAELECASINISRCGMAIKVGSVLELGEALEIVFCLPDDGFSINAQGVAVWDDKHGKAGLSFQCQTLEGQNKLGAWLDRQFYCQLSSTYA